MEKIRISKVDDVTLLRQGIKLDGTLHLTPHHLIFSYVPPQTQPVSKPKPRELWITYPMIAFCSYRPAPPASHQSPSIRLRCRDFVFVAFHFLSESKARDVYDSIKSLTCKLGRIEKLYAFSYRAQGPEKEVNGWNVYDAKREFARQGIGEKNADRGWRISRINANYEYSPTYPAILTVPASISDNVLNYAGRYRSRVRIPILTYLHPVNRCSITRSSQPLVGVRQNRSVQDEKLVAAIFDTSQPNAEGHSSSQVNSQSSSQSTSSSMTSEANMMAEPSSVHVASASGESSFIDAEAIEDETLARVGRDATSPNARIYGAQQHNIIIDARPAVNAFANQAVGMGSENMDNYKFATKAFLGIDNIHVMRDSLNKVMDALKDTDVTPLGPNRELLAKSNWLKHISGILDGASMIARQVGIHHSHVLIHCSDGWDRTSQLSALSQLCLDPYYRTMEGFIVLVEKDWVSCGHQFRHRSGFLSSEKWFEIENERIGGNRRTENGASVGAGGGGNAFEDALLRAKGFFNKKNESRESLIDEDGEMQPFDSPPSVKAGSLSGRATEDRLTTKVKETSPVFHQFLDATYQLLYQHPTRFEFSERFLRRLLYHLYSCQYGTFLHDNEKQRVESGVRDKTRSVWDYFLSRKEQFVNEKYDPIINDNEKGHERLLFPRTGETRWWPEIFGRTDAEMNGPLHAPMQSHQDGLGGTTLTGAETSDLSTGPATVQTSTDMPSARISQGGGYNRLNMGLARMELGEEGGSPAPSRPRTPHNARQEVEVEMR
ncbi:MAG: hypothetical protein M1822_006544 [Bathelium mastoideum]|nr:MAG: hypothetical protein M1822_006544 [Bathelium mastoideum]